MTIAEILAEAERLEREATKAAADGYPGIGRVLHDRLKPFYAEHGPTLLVFCRAAMRYRHHITCGCGYPCSPRTAFDAAVRGDAATGEGRNG